MSQQQWIRMELRRKTVQNTPLPPEGVDMTRQHRHTALSNKLDKAVEEALGEQAPRAFSLKKQGGGDREPTPGPQDLQKGELNITTERWWLEPI